MVASMTGMGSAEAKCGNASIIVEIKSVNNRFLEVSCRMSPLLSIYEKDIRDLVRQFVHRGKLYVTVTVQGEAEGDLGLSVDAATVQNLRALLLDLRKKAGIREPLKLDHFLKFSEIFEARGAAKEEEQLWTAVRESLVSALEKLKTMRVQEGASLAADIFARLRVLEETVDLIENLSRESIPETYARMVERVRQITHGADLDQERVYTELSLLADRLDVTEECVRLRSHLRLSIQAMQTEDQVGKKQTFLLQEMNREVNTISAKSSHAEISHRVVLMKEEIEKLREQAQNLE
jgi:uncharacterized protein (TIGR00255 family)